jgi:outer membrane cobalamin receptor
MIGYFETTPLELEEAALIDGATRWQVFRHSASYNVTWRYGRLTLNTNAYIRGATLDVDPTNGVSACTWYGMPCFFTNKGYTRMDAGFSFRIARGVEMYGRINNLLNRKYEEIFGYPANHANFMGGMRFTISTE